MELLRKGLIVEFILILVAWTADGDTNLKAIQILETADGENESRVLHTIEHQPGRPSLQEMLMSDQTKDLPLLVFSVTGKTRSGKSFLLNLMYKYLQAEGIEGWESGEVPNIFTWKEGTDSTTKGLWISPTIFRRENKMGDEVGIILMDSQGLFDGEVTSGESVAMSGVSTILSHVQMFNMKEDITTNDLEHIMLHLVPDLPEQKNGNTTGTSLMFIIRDFIGGKKSGFGLENGKKYINEEQHRGTEEYRSMWEEHRKVFSDIDCVLLPHPGLRVLTEDFTRSPNLNELDNSFVSEIDKFFRQLFAPKNLVPHKDSLTGKKMCELLEKLNGKPADKSLSYYNMYLERINNANWQQLVLEFNNTLNQVEHLHNLNLIVEEIVSKSKFKGPYAQQKISKLKKTLESVANERVKLFITSKYSESLKSDIPKESHEVIWPIITSFMDTMIVGTEKQAVKNDIIMNISTSYYQFLRKAKEEEFKIACDKANSQEFYDRLLVLTKKEELSSYIASKIQKNGDFDVSSSGFLSQYPILTKERLILGESVRKILLRNMFKVKKYFVDYYAENLIESDIINQNIIFWPDMKSKLDDLQFETESEKNQTVKEIVEDVAKIYYERLRKEQADQMDRKWDQMGKTEFREVYNKYSDPAAMNNLVWELLPQYNDFDSEIWQDEQKLLKVQLELAIYKGLKSKGYDQEASGFWEKYGEKILEKLGNIIVKVFMKSAGVPEIPEIGAVTDVLSSKE